MKKFLSLLLSLAMLLSVAALADALGFSSPAYFSTRFKHTTGQTPREYLKEIGAR